MHTPAAADPPDSVSQAGASADSTVASRLRLAFALSGLGFWSLLLALWSGAFPYEEYVLAKPVAAFVLLQSVGGALYLLALRLLKPMTPSRWLLAAVLVTGLGMRCSQFSSVPILEDDFYRYLWDGAVSAQGLNPYLHSPQEARLGSAGMGDEMKVLAKRSGTVLDRVNHPELRTVYPPVAQAAFAAAYWLSPFDLAGLRWLWLGLDLVIAVVLIKLLRSSSARIFQLSVYWLNPLLVKEVFNSGHMELVLVAAAAGALLAAMRNRRLVSVSLVVLAAGAKVWPALWLPLFLKRCRSGRQVALGAGLFTAMALLLALPVLAGGLDPESGFAVYGARWQMNDSAYLLVDEAFKLVSAPLAPAGGRLLLAMMLGLILFWLLRRPDSQVDLPESMLILTAGLFLLSPTQFPWYYLWLLPLLALRPVWALLGLTVTLPIYYLRFPMDALGAASWFDYGLVWLEFVPVWLLLGVELVRRVHDRRREQSRELPYHRPSRIRPSLGPLAETRSESLSSPGK